MQTINLAIHCTAMAHLSKWAITQVNKKEIFGIGSQMF